MGEIFNTGLLSTNKFSDFDEMAITAASVWGQRYRKLEGKEEYGFARQLNLPSAQLTHIGWQSGIRIETGTPPGSIGFVLQMSGHGRMRANGVTLRPDQILMMHAPRDYDLVNPIDTTYLVLAVDKERVRSHMESLWGELPSRFDDISRLLSASQYQQGSIASVFHHQLDLAYRDSDCIDNAQDRELLVDELLDSILLSSELAKPDQRVANRHQLAKIAAEFLHDNIDSNVTLRVMCDYVGVSERSLRQGFIERFGVTPKAYIKHQRLLRLRQKLRRSHPSQTKVTQAALSVGLTHMGRLSCEYRQLFGENPAETLAGSSACLSGRSLVS